VTLQKSAQTEIFVLLGIITKPHGIRGELKVRPFTETPDSLSRYRHLYLSADNGKTKVLHVNVQTKANGSTVILRLEECATRDQAEQFAGMQIWVPSSDLPPVGQDEFYLYTLEGKLAQTTAGRILGTVTEIVSGSGQDILVIRDARQEYLVPVVRDFFVTIDEEKVVLDLPPGLLEINT